MVGPMASNVPTLFVAVFVFAIYLDDKLKLIGEESAFPTQGLAILPLLIVSSFTVLYSRIPLKSLIAYFLLFIGVAALTVIRGSLGTFINFSAYLFLIFFILAILSREDAVAVGDFFSRSILIYAHFYIITYIVSYILFNFLGLDMVNFWPLKFSTSYDSFRLALFFNEPVNCAIFMALYFLNNRARQGYGGLIPVIGVLLCGSFGGFLVLLAIFIVTIPRMRSKNIILSMVSSLIFFIVLFQFYSDRVIAITDMADGSLGVRLALIEAHINIISKNLFFGVGLGSSEDMLLSNLGSFANEIWQQEVSSASFLTSLVADLGLLFWLAIGALLVLVLNVRDALSWIFIGVAGVVFGQIFWAPFLLVPLFSRSRRGHYG